MFRSSFASRSVRDNAIIPCSTVAK
jgi:hypothetical protein